MTDEVAEDGEIGVEMRELAVGKAGADERSLEPGALAHAQTTVVQKSAGTAACREKLVARRVVDDRLGQHPALGERDRHRKLWQPVQEVRGAVEGVDDPDKVRRAGATTLLC